MKDFAAEIAAHEAEIAELKREQEAFRALTPTQQLAISLHDAQCRYNHTDQCGWFYEIHKGVHDWSGYAHADYLKKARKVVDLLPDFSHDQIIQVSNALRA